MIDMAAAITRRARTIVLTQALLIAIMTLASLLVGVLASVSALVGGLIAMLISWMLRRNMTHATRVAVEDPGKSMRTMYVGAGVRFFVLLGAMAVAIGLGGLEPLYVVGAFVVALVAGALAAKGQDSGRPDVRGS